jgi:hypothetical protein
MRQLIVIALATALLTNCEANAGAWTLDHGQVQMISGLTISHASRGYDHESRPSKVVVFEKQFTQNWVEYGLTDAVTLFVAPEYVSAVSDTGGGVLRVRDASIEGGARILLLSRVGMLSIQCSGKTAGAFDMSVSAGEVSGSQFEFRLLYGRDFKVFGKSAFFDLETAERWIKRPRPNELIIDATAGIRFRKPTLLMLQSFNTISGGGGEPPYKFYRVHKVELSVVEQVTSRWSLQVGAFMSPAGQNVVVESGYLAAVWYRY